MCTCLQVSISHVTTWLVTDEWGTLFRYRSAALPRLDAKLLAFGFERRYCLPTKQFSLLYMECMELLVTFLPLFYYQIKQLIMFFSVPATETMSLLADERLGRLLYFYSVCTMSLYWHCKICYNSFQLVRFFFRLCNTTIVGHVSRWDWFCVKCVTGV